jgi:hypothetical protein
MGMTQEDKEKLDYFQKHALPWQIEHMKFRAIGLQVFIPIQGALLGAWYVSKASAVAWFGLVGCVILYLWDERTQFIIRTIHQWGRDLADKHFFPTDENGNPRDGLHVVFGETLERSRHWIPRRLGDLKSHTFAIRILVVTGIVIWSLILLGILSAPDAAIQALCVHCTKLTFCW